MPHGSSRCRWVWPVAPARGGRDSPRVYTPAAAGTDDGLGRA
jgi:hypothetical protein